MVASLRRFFANLFSDGGPTNAEGMSAEARVDAGLDEAHGGASRDQETRATAEMLSRLGADGATQDAALRVRSKGPDGLR